MEPFPLFQAPGYFWGVEEVEGGTNAKPEHGSGRQADPGGLCRRTLLRTQTNPAAAAEPNFAELNFVD